MVIKRIKLVFSFCIDIRYHVLLIVHKLFAYKLNCIILQFTFYNTDELKMFNIGLTEKTYLLILLLLLTNYW